MPRVNLTDITISKLPLSKERVTYWDEGFPGGAFGVRVGARRKTFIVVVNGGHRIKLGNYPLTTVKEARRAAHLRLSDPRKQSGVIDAEPAKDAVKKFIEIRHARSRPRWRKEQERLLTKHFLSKFKDVPLNRITKKDILSYSTGSKGCRPSSCTRIVHSRRYFPGRGSGK